MLLYCYFNTMYNTLQCNTIQYNTRYNAIQYDIQCNTRYSYYNSIQYTIQYEIYTTMLIATFDTTCNMQYNPRQYKTIYIYTPVYMATLSWSTSRKLPRLSWDWGVICTQLSSPLFSVFFKQCSFYSLHLLGSFSNIVRCFDFTFSNMKFV